MSPHVDAAVRAALALYTGTGERLTVVCCACMGWCRLMGWGPAGVTRVVRHACRLQQLSVNVNAFT